VDFVNAANGGKLEQVIMQNPASLLEDLVRAKHPLQNSVDEGEPFSTSLSKGRKSFEICL